MNQDIRYNEIQKFFNDIGVTYIYSRINRIELDDLNSTNKWGSLPIDTIAASEGILEYIEGCKLLSYAEIAISNHWLYVIDMNLEEYFEDNFSS